MMYGNKYFDNFLTYFRKALDFILIKCDINMYTEYHKEM